VVAVVTLVLGGEFDDAEILSSAGRNFVPCKKETHRKDFLKFTFIKICVCNLRKCHIQSAFDR
jgi:hypothetical protein